MNDGKKMMYSRYTIHSADLNEPMQVYYAPPFQGTLRIPSSQVESFYNAFKAFESIMSQEDLILRTRLAKGECVVFANRRVLHARDSFEASSGERHFQGTYVDWDEFKDKVMNHLHT